MDNAFRSREHKVLKEAEQFMAVPRYKQYFEMLEDSPYAKIRKMQGASIDSSDISALGLQFQQFEDYKRMMLESGNVRDLGKLPTFAFDVITATYGASIIPLLASVQPIESSQGLVYFKAIQALNTKGNVVAGDILRRATRAPDKQAVGYAGASSITTIGPTVAGTFTYSGNLPQAPVRPNTVNVTVPSTVMKGQADSDGNILGIGIQGTVNFATGVIEITFINDPGNGAVIVVTYETDYEESGVIPRINSIMETSYIQAQQFVVGSQIGLFKEYELMKRFGMQANEEMIKDLTQEINAEVGNTLITKMVAAAQGITHFDYTPSANISEVNHRLSLFIRIAEAESKMVTASGRGAINVMIAGAKALSVLETSGDFKKTGFVGSGPTLYGTYRGNIPVIRATQTIASDEIVCVYKGTSQFDTPAVYAPYMPLVVNSQIPQLNNMLKKQGYAALWAGLEVLVPNFITKIKIDNIFS